MPYHYRTALRSDAAACTKILRAWGQETPWMVPIDSRPSLIDFWGDIFEDDIGWVAEQNGIIAGFCARSDDNIAGLFLRPDARNQGVGARLLDLAKENRDWITVWAYALNTDARRFYLRHGLVEVSREIETFNDGSSLEDVEHRWIRPGKAPAIS